MIAFWARSARGQLEDALGPDVRTWPWSLRLSFWLDALVLWWRETPR